MVKYDQNKDKKKHGVSFLVNKKIAGNIEIFNGICERMQA